MQLHSEMRGHVPAGRSRTPTGALFEGAASARFRYRTLTGFSLIGRRLSAHLCAVHVSGQDHRLTQLRPGEELEQVLLDGLVVGVPVTGGALVGAPGVNPQRQFPEETIRS